MTNYRYQALGPLQAGEGSRAFLGLAISADHKARPVVIIWVPEAALSNCTSLGNGTVNTASNQVRIGNVAVTSIGGQVGWTTLSDARFKRDVRHDVPGLELVMRLRPASYTYDLGAIKQATAPDGPDTSRVDGTTVRHTGFLAQEVEAAAAELGYDFSGVDAPKNADDLYGLRYAEFVVPLVKAVQEQQVLILPLQEEVARLRTMAKR